MPLQEQILNAIYRERSMLSEVLKSVHRTEGKVDALSSRVDRIEDREHRRTPSIKLQDLAPLIPGIIALILVLTGKMSATEATQMLSGK